MFKVRHSAVALLACLSMTLAVRAQEADKPKADAEEPKVTLHVGDAAPALTPSKWIKGEPVAKFDAGKIYIVEFWATWCGPCKESIPHLTKMQKANPDVTFIGQDCSEQDQSVVPAFVKEMGDKMDYRVALDDMTDAEHGKMDSTWMVAAGQDGIPTAFVVGKDGKIAWIGHPMELEPILKQVVAGTFDPKKEAENAKLRDDLREEISKDMESGDNDAALTAIDKLIKAQPDLADEVAPQKYEILMKKKDYAAALPLAKTLVETQKDNSDLLNEIAWSMVDPENLPEKPDLDLAQKAAERANEITKGENGPILDTLARVYFNQGKVDKAIELQTKAVDKAEEGDQKDGIAKTLEEYKEKKGAAK